MSPTPAVPLALWLSFAGTAPAPVGPGAPGAGTAAPGWAPGPVSLPEPVAVPPAAAGLPLPPPLLAAQAGDDPGDEDEIEEEIQAESAEMEAMREAEERAALPPPRPEEGVARSSAWLGLESPLRQRIGEALSRDAAGPAEDQGRIPLFPEIDHDLRQLQAEYDIPIEVNEAVLAYVRFFQTEPARGHFLRWLGRYQKHQQRLRDLLQQHDLPGDTVFLAMIESGFANFAYSRARASGPWQFIAATGRRMGLRQDFWVDERRDPEKSARAAARYLKELHQQTGDWRLAWAGYNAGVNRILRALRTGQSDFWAMTRGRIIRKETKGYVPKLMAAAIVTKHQEAFGFRPEEVEPERWEEHREVTVTHAADLGVLARAAGVSERELRDLNPELRRSCTPPRPYALRVPAGRAEAFARAWPALEPSARLSFASHRVQRGDSLAAVAAAYGVSAASISRMNGLRSSRLRAGTELVVPLTALARRNGAPSTAAAARARIEEHQRRNPDSVEPEPERRQVVARVEQVGGRTRATVLVQAGDSLWAIARKFGVALEDLCRWNGIRNPRRFKLPVGRELVVYPPAAPAAGGAPGPG